MESFSILQKLTGMALIIFKIINAAKNVEQNYIQIRDKKTISSTIVKQKSQLQIFRPNQKRELNIFVSK